MKIALIGDGAMGKLVAELAGEQAHEVAIVLNSRDAERVAEDLTGSLRGCDVVIDFSVANAVLRNVAACMFAGVPLIEGTTGWQDSQLGEVRRIVNQGETAMVYGANFSVGVQMFFRIAANAAELFRELESYDAFIQEAHHKRKRDAPSGTALQLGQIVAEHLGREVPIAATRAGYIPGTHQVGFDSKSDQILLSHTARGREGFAVGALMAADWIIGRKGLYEFSEVIDEILSQNHLR